MPSSSRSRSASPTSARQDRMPSRGHLSAVVGRPRRDGRRARRGTRRPRSSSTSTAGPSSGRTGDVVDSRAHPTRPRASRGARPGRQGAWARHASQTLGYGDSCSSWERTSQLGATCVGLACSSLARVSELNESRAPIRVVSMRASLAFTAQRASRGRSEKARPSAYRYVAEADLSRVLDTWASDRSSLEARFEDVERRLARTDELDDLSRRLDAVEHGPHGVFSPADGPVPGDGRFRLELRALELRLEQAESAAFEGRDAVLAQLARMRSRRWRRRRCRRGGRR